MPFNIPPPYRLPLLLLGFVGLLIGTGAGLARFGWPMPTLAAAAAGEHGAFMLCGFFGVVIALERAVAIGRAWAYLGPLLAGAGTLALTAGKLDVAAAAFLGGSAVLLVATIDIARRQRALFTATLAVAAACWCVGVAWWLSGAPVFAVAPWWLAFVVLTIAAERLELSRFLPPSRAASAVFVAIVVALLAGLAFATDRTGRALVGVALLGMAVWLLKQDIARRTIRARGLTRYIAACLLAGYGWLGVAGGLIAASDALVPGSPARDVALHALGLGFVFSMVFGHAAIIVPAVMRTNVPYHPAFYVALVLLHASLLLRVVGDAVSLPIARAGAMGNAVALAAFIVTIIAAVIRGRRVAERPARPTSA